MSRTRFATAVAVTVMIGSSLPAGAYERPEGHTQLDLPPGAGIPEGTAFGNSLSSNGSVVAFDTDAGLLPEDVNLKSDLYVRDERKHTLQLASRTLLGTAPIGSANASCATALRNLSGKVSAYSGAEGPWSYSLVTHDLALSWDPAISGNGRYVAFVSHAVNLVPGDTDLAPDVYLFDRKSQDLTLISDEGNLLDIDVDVPCPASWSPSIDGKGKKVSFTSLAPLTPEDKNDRADIYVFDRPSGRLTLASTSRGKGCEAPESPLPTSATPSTCGIGASHSSLSADGRFVAFQSDDADLVPDDTNAATDVFVTRLRDGKVERVSLDSQGDQLGDRTSGRGVEPYSGIALTPYYGAINPQLPQHSISRDGRYVVFFSNVWDAVPNPDPMETDVIITGYYVRDRKTGRTTRVNVTEYGQAGPSSNIEGNAPGISADGRYVEYPRVYRRYQCLPALHCSVGEIGPVLFDTRTGAPDIFFKPIVETPLPCEQAPSIYPAESMAGWFGDMTQDGRYVSFAICRPELQDRPDAKTYRNHIIRFDRGEPTPTTVLKGTSSTAQRESVTASRIVAEQQELLGASVVTRPQYGDVFATIDLAYMPPVTRDSASPLVYGFHFTSEGKRYEVRSSSIEGGTFALFDCTSSPVLCRKVSDLRGGYGTTGMRIVVSIPSADIGVRDAGSLTDVEAFTAIGSTFTGSLNVVERMGLR